MYNNKQIEEMLNKNISIVDIFKVLYDNLEENKGLLNINDFVGKILESSKDQNKSYIEVKKEEDDLLIKRVKKECEHMALIKEDIDMNYRAFNDHIHRMLKIIDEEELYIDAQKDKIKKYFLTEQEKHHQNKLNAIKELKYSLMRKDI